MRRHGWAQIGGVIHRAERMGKTIFIVFPNSWDAKQLRACQGSWAGRFDVVFGEPTDEACPWDLDVLAYIAETVAARRGRVAGVMSSSDYPGATVAAALATRLGLPGDRPETIIQASHKYYSRVNQARVVPDATPRFWLVDPERPVIDDIPFPSFIKPVKGAFSVMSRRLDSRAELQAFLARPATREFIRDYVHLFNQLVAGLTDLEVSGSHFLVEEMLHGSQVTVEGFAAAGRVEVLGIVDSVMHPGTGSFARFDYPSSLPLEIQDRMAGIARQAAVGLGLQQSCFNIEMIYEPIRDRIRIIEINPRLCGQFGDLYQKVDGDNGYQIALSLAVGEAPVVRRREGRYRVASSFPLRIFEPVRVTHAPEDVEIAAVEEEIADAMIWTECRAGQTLADFDSVEDGRSCRYAVVNVGAADRAGLLSALDTITTKLDFRFEPVHPPA